MKFNLVDIPLLFESGLLCNLFGVKVVVACTPKLQLDRMMKRNPDWGLEQCERRIASQIPIGEKIDMADVIIWNNDSLKDLEAGVKKAVGEIQELYHWNISLVPWIIFFFAYEQYFWRSK
mmetsp:Transcript_53347/g.53766  ORF Transcript_53347/g.53766 Transcript_53347/m.53766 type:complete len:120 (-) Transcript_53347:4-363(-)